jgi:hypothetical protein
MTGNMQPNASSVLKLRTSGRQRILLAAAMLCVIGLLTVGGARPAGATTAWPSHSSYVSTSGGWSYVRSCPNTGCSAQFLLSNGSPVWMLCWTDAQWATGNYSSNRWFYIYSYNGYGYVHSSLVYNQAPSPPC